MTTKRVLTIPRRPVPAPSEIVDLSPVFVRGTGAALFTIQSWALAEIAATGGLLAPIGVGEGKTLITLLAARAYDIHKGRDDTRTLLLVPASLRDQLAGDLERYNADFGLDLRDRFVVWSYARLSSPASARDLESYAPDLIVADEAHRLRNPTATRTRRVARYFSEHQKTGFVALSGTLTSKSLRDYAHLAAWALGEGAPLPLSWTWLSSWAAVMDAEGVPGPQDIGAVQSLIREFGEDTDEGSVRSRARAAYRRRFEQTPGVVTTPENTVGASLVLARRPIAAPPVVLDAIEEVEATWQVPDGDCFDSHARLADVTRQIGQGFFYRWVWPDGVADVEWLEARSAWRKAVRTEISKGRPGLDSPALVARAVDLEVYAECKVDVLSGVVGSSRPMTFHFATRSARLAWLSQSHKPAPPVEVVWLSDYLVDDAVAWALDKPGRVVWYAHDAVGVRLGEKGLRVFGPGNDPKDAPASCAASLRAHGTGKNMQGWAQGLVLCPPSSGAAWEQLLGRLHRTGQEADEVRFEFYAHLETYQRAFEKAGNSARYIEQTQGVKQRLNYAPILGV